MGLKVQKLVDSLLKRRSFIWYVITLLIIKFALSFPLFQLATILEPLEIFTAREIIQETNNIRSLQNLSVLKENEKLNESARQKLDDMLAQNYFLHISPEGITPWFWMQNNGYQYSMAGENLAVGFITAKDTAVAWFNSPLHKENLLNSNYEEIGVAVGRGNVGKSKGIVVVQMFGKPFKPIVAAGFQQNVVVPPVLPTETEIPSVVSIVQETESPLPVKGEAIVPIQYLSTDNAISPVNEVLKVEISLNQGGIDNLSGVVNGAYSIFILLLSIVSFAFFILVNRNKKYLRGALFSTSLFVLSLILPVVSIPHIGLIF